VRYQSRKVLLLCGGALIAVMTLTGCGGSSTHTAGLGSPSASQSVPGSSSPSPSSPSASPAGKTCSASHTAAMINGKSKCLAAGQQCSGKAINQYPQYGYICAESNGKLVLRRKQTIAPGQTALRHSTKPECWNWR